MSVGAGKCLQSGVLPIRSAVESQSSEQSRKTNIRKKKSCVSMGPRSKLDDGGGLVTRNPAEKISPATPIIVRAEGGPSGGSAGAASSIFFGSF